MPTAPTPYVSGYNHAYISVAWSGGTGWDFLELWRDAGVGFSLYQTIYGGGEIYADYGVAPKTLYAYKIRIWGSGEYSEFSSTCSATTLALPPYGLTAYGYDLDTIRLNWTNGDTYEYLDVYRRRESEETFACLTAHLPLGGTITQYDDDTPVASAKYFYHIIPSPAVSIASDQAEARTKPYPPTSLSITSRNDYSITLGWTNGQPYTKIHVYRQTGGSGPFVEIDVLDGYPTTYMDGDIEPTQIYAYYLIGENDGQMSAASNTATTAAPIPATPTGLAAELQSDNHVKLTWANAGTYDYICVERKTGAAAYAEIGKISGTLESYDDGNLLDGTLYYYQIRAQRFGAYSSYATEVSQLTALNPPSHPSATCISKTEVKLTWHDTNQTETKYKIYRDGAYLSYVVANVIVFNDTPLTPGTWYRYTVTAYNASTESLPCDEIEIFTWDPPAVPSDLEAHSVSTTRIDLLWRDNSDNETGFSIEQSPDGEEATYAEVTTVGPGVTSYSRTGLTSNTPYWFRVHAYNSSGDSGYSNVATTQTFAAIAKPTNVVLSVAKVGGSYGVEITFDDNSELEDSHRIERKLSGGAYAEIVTLAPNQIYYFDTGVSAGSTYLYKIRAKQGSSSYSSYSDEATITIPPVPPVPSTLAISEHTDTTMRLTWLAEGGNSSNAVGFAIEKSTDGGANYTEIARVRAGVEYYLVTGLTAGATYYFKIRAYSGAGYSAYAAAAHETCDTVYQATKFELFIRNPSVKPVILCEINPLMRLSGFTLTAGKTYTYEATIQQRGIRPDAVYQNGAAYLIKTSTTNVEAIAGTFYFDYTARKLYIHTTSGIAPGAFIITISFKLYFTNYRDADFAADFNGDNYLPLLNTENIPEFSSEIKPYYEGNFVISAGSFSIINAKLSDGYYFDRRYALYEWRNRPVVWKMGAVDWAYADYYTFCTGLISDDEKAIEVNDRMATFSMKDLRANLEMTIPTDKVADIEYYNVDSGAAGKVKPRYYGAVTNGATLLVDTVNRRYMFQNGRVKSIQAVKQNDTTLTASDYYIDYKRGTVTLSRSLTWDVKDIIGVDFHGVASLADEEINNGAEIFLDIMLYFPGLTVSDLNLDSIYATKYGYTTTITVPLYRERALADVIKTLERTLCAWTFQDQQGRIGLTLAATTATSPVIAVQDYATKEYSQYKGTGSLFGSVKISYNENPQTQKYEILTRENLATQYVQSASAPLPVNTFHNSLAAAAVLAAQIIAELNKDFMTFKTGLILFPCLPGHVIPFSRERYFSVEGAADSVNIRLLSIGKSLADRSVTVTAVEA